MKKRLHNRVNREVLLDLIKKDTTPRTTISFYKYAKIGNPQFFRDHLYLLLDEVETLGRIYVSQEGINAQVSCPTEMLKAFRNRLNQIVFLENCRLNFAIEDDGKSFFKLTIKVRHKIVADGLDDASFDVTQMGKHVNAEEFNALSEDPNTVIVDMRNHYESEVGHFKNAITPDVETFREELPIVEQMLSDQKDKNLLLYCTGGIRCEKASAYFKHKGFEKVFQLEGGIIEYTRQVNKKGLENKFIGKNFVFDERLGERISPDVIAHCHQCGDLCDTHVNCANEACHILFIQCPSCADKNQGCCSEKCSEFIQLPAEERESLIGKVEFNGTKFGKGRYKAHNHAEGNLT
ncbi:MAG: rhodanese-related sulfurtransferase [Saprospiraceae bacterium]|nr:rhodanese-related sulfurtransferase [Saprospiraceae bacterium]MBK8632232.1 rhodanese-related sulfurtransferase [Saprospiraceae bacterium]MBP7641819.1 rhodanese-related sulfurtransferase [Saprospiraceae bacterium]